MLVVNVGGRIAGGLSVPRSVVLSSQMLSARDKPEDAVQIVDIKERDQAPEVFTHFVERSLGDDRLLCVLLRRHPPAERASTTLGWPQAVDVRVPLLDNCLRLQQKLLCKLTILRRF